MLALLFACVLRTGPEPVASGAAEPVSFGPLEEKVALLLGETTDADQRVRLEQARELMFSMRGKDPAAQRLVYAYLEKVVTVEERVRPQLIAELAFEDMVTVEEIAIAEPSVQEAPLEAPPPGQEPTAAPTEPSTPAATPLPTATLVAAREALAAGRYTEAADMLAGIDDDVAETLRKEAIDGWARAERERAGQLFIEARKLGPGAERDAAIAKVKEILAGVNTRYPDNAYAAQIAQHISRVDAEAASP